MPSYLDFDSTKKFRDFIIGRTLNVPNGPQTFNSTNYAVQSLNDISNVDPGAVDTNRKDDLIIPQTKNIFKPEDYFIRENLNTLPRRANLSLYADNSGNPYFVPRTHNLIGIMTTKNYDNESELFKFAASYIRDNTKKGPVYARIQQNLYKSTVGRVRLIDALQGNLATATNIITGKEPLIESNYSITVGKTVLGKGVDFLQTIAGVESPIPRIPGDYFAPPANAENERPRPRNEVGRILQDATGAIGSLLGIQRRPLASRKPSDLFIEYMGSGQKQVLFDLLSYSKYGPDYTTTARSQNTSKLFNFIDKIGQSVRSILGTEAPKKASYIGDDRSSKVQDQMTELTYGNQIKSPYYLSTFFDPELAKVFKRQRNFTESGNVGGNLTWYSKKSQNKLGANNPSYPNQNLPATFSTEFNFKSGSILNKTQELLDSIPEGGEARSHVANVINQTSRIFKEGDIYLSRGSNVQYVDKYGALTGEEFCRTWTKDRPYLTYNDTMKKGMNIRKFEGSVMSDPWNLNIAPVSTNKNFDSSTNIKENYKFGSDADGKSFYAKKYMLSLENLAWKTSNRKGFTVLDLPYNERGPNGGRVMWFPPYDLKVNETNSARWESNTFLGRPEPIYTYQNTERNATLSFKVIVDHPSILNVLTREYFKDKVEPEKVENEINAFFAGCQNYDFYDLMKRYTKLSKNDIELILQYLNEGGSKEVILDNKNVLPDPVQTNNAAKSNTGTDSSSEQSTRVSSSEYKLHFDNNTPSAGSTKTQTNDDFNSLYTSYISQQGSYVSQLSSNLGTLSGLNTTDAQNDKKIIYGKPTDDNITVQTNKLTNNFNEFQTSYQNYNQEINELKNDLVAKKVQFIELEISSAASSLGSDTDNLLLSTRRSYSVLYDFFKKISKDGNILPKINWFDENETNNTKTTEKNFEYNLKDFGWGEIEGQVIVTVKNYGESYQNNSATSVIDKDCANKDFKAVTNLNIVSPISFYCRHSGVKFHKTITTQAQKPANPTTPVQTNVQKSRLEPNGQTVIKAKSKKPPVDVMKRIIMKTLSESYYFEKLEATSPMVFQTLKDKLRFFHPAFHSMTPEGLNSRLTFLLQCVRPGDTMPIKGMSDESDLNARNTTFGPPPICVLRIGDFYHSKVVIRDIQISYEENLWDLNPEGIGIQPMVANVTLQMNFIGGQGLEKPIERLQNALSSNFFANTEIYDERSESTNQFIAGQEASGFTADFLRSLNSKNEDLKVNNENKGNDNTEEKYIGTLNNNELSYTELVNNVFETTKGYLNGFIGLFNTINIKYGSLIADIIFSKNYRAIKDFNVYFNNGGYNTLELFGLYQNNLELSILIQNCKNGLSSSINANNIVNIFGLNTILTTAKATKANEILKPFLIKTVNDLLDELSSSQSVKGFEQIRNSFINNLDKLNFVVKIGKDFQLKNNKGKDATLNGFSSSTLYDYYKDCIDYLITNGSTLYSQLSTSIDFTQTTPSINSTDLSSILSVLLYNKKYEITDQLINYQLAMKTSIFTDDELADIDVAMETFVVLNTNYDFNLPTYPIRTSKIEIKYSVSGTSEVSSGATLEEAKKLFSPQYNSGTDLNYYKI